MDIASSASSSSSSSSSASDSGSEDELTPSPLRGGDESVELEASKFKPDSGGDDKSYGSADSGEESEGGDGQEDETLGDQLAARRHDGVRGPNRSGAEEARRRALAVASGRLAALREEKKIKDGTVTSEGGTTKKRRRKRGAEPFFEEERSESLSDGSDCEGLEAATSAKLDEDPISSKNTSKARKKSKHRPTEASSKRSDYYARGAPNLNSSGLGVAVGANRYKPRDPRMQSLSGHFDATLFDHKYEFLEKVQEDEIKQLKKRLVARKKSGRSGLKARRKLGLTQPGAGSLEDDKLELNRLQQELADRRREQDRRSAKTAVKRKIRQEVAEGKRGEYHLKRREKKRLELEARFDNLRKSGGDAAVDKAIAKRRKKAAAKDRRLMPRLDDDFKPKGYAKA